MDIEGELLSRFSTLGTTDRDVLIAEFKKFVGDQTPDASCAFFLDMNNWLVLNIELITFIQSKETTKKCKS